MAQLAIGGAGALVGGLIGGPFGASVGWMAGSLIGTMLFPAEGQDIRNEGPRLQDKRVSASSYGEAIAICYGTMRVAGNMIWSTGIEEEKNVSESSQGGGKGGGGGGTTTTTITYSYFASFAMAFAEGTADDLLRVWADGKLIYDKTGTGKITNEGINWRFYNGSETQLPDALIEADVGADACPAHRGLCYMVIERMPLQNFGNRIPNITAEITFKGVDAFPEKIATLDFSDFGVQTDEMAYDPKRQYAYMRNAGPNGGLRRVNTRTMVEDVVVPVGDVTNSDYFTTGLFASSLDGYIYTVVGTGSNSAPILRIDGNTLTEVTRFGVIGNNASNSGSGFVLSTDMATATVFSPEGIREYFNVFIGLFDDWGILNSDMLAVGWGSFDETNCFDCVAGAPGEVFFTCGTTAGFFPVGVYKLDIEYGAALTPQGFSLGTNMVKKGTLGASDLAPLFASATRCNIQAMVFDQLDDNLILLMDVTDGGTGKSGVMKLDPETMTQIWFVEVPSVPAFGVAVSQGTVKNGRFAFNSGSGGIISMDTRDGSFVTYGNGSYTGAITSAVNTYEATEDALIYYNGGKMIKAYLNRGSGEGESLADIVTDVSLRVGLSDSDIDVTELTDVVPGYMLGRQVTGRGALEPLMASYFFDGVETDYKMVFKKKGGTPAKAIVQNNLGLMNNSMLEESRIQEVELPVEVDYIHFDNEKNYEQGTQRARRPLEPLPTMHSRNVVSMNMPIAMTASTAKSIAHKAMYASWLERNNFKFKLPWQFLMLDPADIITLTMNDGTVYTTRLVGNNVGVDMVIEMDAVNEEQTIYTVSETADSGSGVPDQAIVTFEPAEIFLLNTPLLRDQDDTNGSFSRGYYTFAAFSDNWTGAFLYRTQDKLTWSQIDRSSTSAVWGVVPGTLSAPVNGPWQTDEDNTITVVMLYGADQIQSVTQLQMVNDANAALIGDEIIGFREAVEVSPGRFELTGLLRGRRGTEWACGSHVNGEKFILLDTAWMKTITTELAALNTTRTYRGVTFGTLFEDGDDETFAYKGYDLKPYAPVQLQAADSSGDVVFTWVRRTRVAGQLRDGYGTVPLSEDTEEYEVDIYISGSVVRTYTVTSPTATYTAADQTTDGFTGSTIEIAVYQISAAIGRGFEAKETLTIV